jgi:hypothetical protein
MRNRPRYRIHGLVTDGSARTTSAGEGGGGRSIPDGERAANDPGAESKHPAVPMAAATLTITGAS